MVLRPTILLGLLCVALAANISPSLIRGYRTGHHYVYEFDGQIASSLSNGEDYSTIRVRSQVDLDFLTDKNVLVKLGRTELGSLNGFLDQPERIHSFQKFEQLEVKGDHVSKLDLPFQIRYDNGKVSEIKFHREDSLWSENIKRSIVNLLQVQLESTTNDDQAYPASFYKTNETTIEGECESVYYIQKLDGDYQSVDETKPSVNITKTISFEKCQRRPELRYNYYRQSEPLDWNAEKGQSNAIEPVVDATSQYDISLENDMIQNAKVLSKYSYDLVDKEHVSLKTYTAAQLSMKSSEKRTAPENDFPQKPAQSLMHSNEFDLLRERFITEGDEKYLTENPYLRLQNAGDVVKNIMRRLVKSSIDKEDTAGMEEDATRQFTHLVSILRLCSKEDIKQIHNDIFMGSEFSEKSQQFVKEILADALAVAGTKNTIDHLVEKIEAEEISASKAARTLEKLYKLRLTSVEMANPIWKLCETSEVVRKNANLKRSCYLAWGAMINAMCGHNHEHEQDHEKWAISSSNKKICSPEMKKQFIEGVMKMYRGSSLKSDKILALKTLGNMGIDVSISTLEQIILDKSEDRLVRVHAIDALRILRDQIPQQVQRLLTPIFRDRREYPEIRMSAFNEILQTRPDPALMHMLCSDLIHETNVDVKSFVITSMKRLAENSDNILDEEFMQTIKSCMVMLDEMHESIIRQSASKKHQIGYFSDPSNWHELGSLFSFTSIFSNDSYLPKEIMASWDLLMDGKIIPNNWQLGVHMQELEQLVSRLSQNMESKSFDDIVIRGRRSLADQYNPFEMLKNLFNKMKLAARRNPADAEPMLLFYRRHANLDYSFFLLDEANLPEILKKLIVEGKIDVSTLEETDMIIRTNGAAYNFESQMKLPTTMGIPMVITSRMATIGFIDGKYSLAFSGPNEQVRNAKIELNIQPQIATSVIVKMELFSPLFTSGVKTIHSMQGRLPLNMNVEIKSPNLVPTISWTLPEQETRLIHLQTRPITFIRTWPAKSNVFIDAKEKTLLVPSLERLHTTNDFDVQSPFTNMIFAIEGHGYKTPWTQYDWLLSGENAFVVKIKPTEETAKVVRLSGEHVTLRDSVSSKQKLEKIFDEQPGLFQQQSQEEIDALREYIRGSASKLTEFQKTSLKLETEGANKNSINVDLKVACNEHAHMCLFEKDVKVDFGNPWTWKTIGQIARPELKDIYASGKSGHVVAKIEHNWGSAEKNTVTMNVYGKPSDQRIHQFKTLLNKNVDISDKAAHENMLDEKFEELPSFLKPNQFSMAIEHQLTEDTRQSIVPLYNWMKVCPRASVYLPDSSKVDSAIARRHSTLTAHITYDNALNLTLATPEENMELLNWESNSKFSRNPKTIVDLFASSHDDYAKCTYKRDQIETFDGKSIDIPLTTCYTLLAKDCGDESNPKFAIMAKKLTKHGKDLKVKFITKNKAYELYKDERDGQMVIKVDDIIVREAEFDQYNIRKIRSNDMTIYELKCPHAQAILRFDGQKIIVKIADIYMNRQCGVCGHLNNDREDDFLKNDNTQAKSVQDFHLSYMFRDAEECDPAVVRELEDMDMKPKSRRRSDVESSNDEDDSNIRSPIKKTVVIEKRRKICFSLKPVHGCPRNFEMADNEGKQVQEEVDFACFERSSTKAQRYLREARNGVIAFENEQPSFTDKIVVPRRCVQY